MARRDEFDLRRELVEVCRRAYQRGMISGTDGNLSARLDEERLLVTPAGVNKGYLEPADLVEVDLDGRAVGSGRPSTEVLLHTAVYRHRVDAMGVVHAHPPSCVALTLVKIGMDAPVIPEIVGALGEVPTAPYATPGTTELPASFVPLLAGHDAILLERHGSVTLGASVSQAMDRLEMIEHAATILVRAHSMGLVTPLPPEAVKRLRGGSY
ncbi:MAG TPA: class II aldolase/adducin family protein [bacterium]|nr:class II aldolase/adducin family protein [bacterium]